MFVDAIIFAHIADYITARKIFTVNFARKMWNSIGENFSLIYNHANFRTKLNDFFLLPALYGGAGALLILALFDTDATGAIALLTVAVGLNAACYNGYLCNHLDLSPNFAGILMGITNGLANITSILAPTIAGFIVKNEVSTPRWKANGSSETDWTNRHKLQLQMVDTVSEPAVPPQHKTESLVSSVDGLSSLFAIFLRRSQLHSGRRCSSLPRQCISSEIQFSSCLAPQRLNHGITPTTRRKINRQSSITVKRQIHAKF